MTKEQIINNLTELVNDIPLELHLNSTRTAKLCAFLKSVFACITELTEENERLKKAKYIYATVDYCADDLAKALAENKRLAEEKDRYKRYYLNHEYDKMKAEVRADTVRQMRQLLEERIKHIPQHHFTLSEVGWCIDQTTLKMLEGNNADN